MVQLFEYHLDKSTLKVLYNFEMFESHFGHYMLAYVAKYIIRIF